MIIRIIVLSIAIALAALAYRKLVSSRSFHKFVSGFTNPTPITDDEVIDSLESSHRVADEHTVDAEAEIAKRQQALERIREANRK